MNSIADIDAALAQVQTDIANLDQSLSTAKQRHQQLLQQKKTALKAAEEEKRRAQQAAAAAAAASTSPSKEQIPTSPNSAKAYHERIAELKRQIAEAEAAKQAVEQHQQQHDDDEEEDESEEEEEYYEEEIIEEEVTEDEEQHLAEASFQQEHASPMHDNPSANNYANVRQDQLDALKNKNQWSQPDWGAGNSNLGAGEVQTYENHKTPDHSHLNDTMRSLKQKHKWEKPAWASQSNEVEEEAGIDSNPIQNPMLKKNQHSGYTRQVFAKDNLSRSNGTFVAPTTKPPPPRLCWVVVEINKRKVGKIVMHLYGQGTNRVVDQFESLKGTNIERQGKNKPMTIEGFEEEDFPKFFISINASIKGLEKERDIYGIVQEGKEVVGAIKSAEEHAVISIKQAHIYPVKKARSS